MLSLNMGAFGVGPKCSKWIICVCAGGLNCEHFQLLHVVLVQEHPVMLENNNASKSMTKNTQSQRLIAMSTKTAVRVKIKRHHHKPVKTCLKNKSHDHTYFFNEK